MLRDVDPVMKELSPGTTVGDDFQVERPLSAGGMGAVYVALMTRHGDPSRPGRQRPLPHEWG